MYRRYQTNQQAWDEVTNEIIEQRRRSEVANKLFPLPNGELRTNFIGLTNEQRDEVYKNL